MEEDKELRWKQRFVNFEKALGQLGKFTSKKKEFGLSEMEEQGLIKSFEYTYELAWNMIKDFYTNQADVSIQGSRDAIKTAFNRGLIKDGQVWIDMVESRILTVHTYDQNMATDIIQKIAENYYPLFLKLDEKMKNLL